ncbi:hypothetical protein ABTX62_05165 [Streptomyces sp. NPDC096046]|uniref:hypothetical protein n=1 Tax=Streptomyces sp. NPDC096046 TaxID=3155542 RepID=UPI0033290A21
MRAGTCCSASGATWHGPPVDLLAGAPGWLPHDQLKDLLSGCEPGCVHRSENGAWARAAYAGTLDDDGLDCGMSRFTDRTEVLHTIADEEHGATSAATRRTCRPTRRTTG